MADFRALGGASVRLGNNANDRHEQVMPHRPLKRIMAFVGRDIDDVINDPISRNLVKGYYKLYRQIERSSEVTELEKQWNPLK